MRGQGVGLDQEEKEEDLEVGVRVLKKRRRRQRRGWVFEENVDDDIEEGPGLLETPFFLSKIFLKLSQFMSKPCKSHLVVVHVLLRYLKSSPGQDIFLTIVTDFQILAFPDSDWGACLDTCRSIIGFCIFLGNSLVSWKPKK